MTTCDFTLTKRNDLGRGYGQVYLLSVSGSQQTVNSGSSVRFNNFSKLSGIAWMTQAELTVLKTSTYQIDFRLNYENVPNVQVAIFVNGNAMIGSYGASTLLPSGTSQLSGVYTLKLNQGDKIRLINISNPFILKPSGFDDEIIATLTISEL